MKQITTAFSPDYFTARERFRAAATARGCRVQSLPISATGPQDEPLTIDVGLLGPSAARRVVVVSGGLHGVEGFFGSAVQLQFLQEELPRRPLPGGTSLVLLHALNPLGFARLRRTDANNVDLNRNFLTPEQQFRGHPSGYAALDRLINPARPPSRWEPFAAQAAWAVMRHGVPALKQALAAGQYDFPKGLFYGGSGPSETSRIIEQNMPGWIAGASRVFHLDFHTGLGKWATHKLLFGYTLDDDEWPWLQRHFAADVLQQCDPRAVAFRHSGGMGVWCRRQFSKYGYTHLSAEFGTYPIVKVFAGLRAENQAHHWGRPQDPGTARAKSRLKELFCPSCPRWRERTVAEAVGLIRAASDAVADA